MEVKNLEILVMRWFLILDERLKRMSQQLDDLTAQVAANTQVEASAIQLIQGLVQRLNDAGTDPAKLEALKTELATSAQSLGAAIAANTPAQPGSGGSDTTGGGASGSDTTGGGTDTTGGGAQSAPTIGGGAA